MARLQGVSSIIVSHDSGFLDAVCTDIIHYEKRKLVRYKGNLSEFVKVRAPPPSVLVGCLACQGVTCFRQHACPSLALA